MKIEFGKKAQIIIALLLMIGAAGAIAEYGNNINIPGNFTGLNGIFSGDISANDITVSGTVDGVDISTIPGTYVAKSGDTMSGNLVFSNSQKIIGGTATTADLTLQTTSGVGASGADMHFIVGNNGATEAMTILNSGFVGIGTTTPANKLEIVSSDDTRLKLVDGTAFLMLRADQNAISVNAGTGEALRFASNNAAPSVILDTSGRFGIGTLTPTERLSVSGNINTTGNINATGNIAAKNIGGVIYANQYATIQDAINATPNGGRVYIPCGRYNESIQITKRLSLEGCGGSAGTLGTADGLNGNMGTVLEQPSSTTNVISILFSSSVEGIKISNLVIWGASLADSGNDLQGNGIFINSSGTGWIENVWIEHMSRNGIVFNNTAQGWWVRDTFIVSNRQSAVVLKNQSHANMFTNVHAEGNAVGFDLRGDVQWNKFVGSWAWWHSSDGFKLTGDSVGSPNRPKYNQFVGIDSSENGGNGINIVNSDNNIFSNVMLKQNDVYGITGSAFYNNTFSSVTAESNSFDNPGSYYNIGFGTAGSNNSFTDFISVDAAGTTLGDVQIGGGVENTVFIGGNFNTLSDGGSHTVINEVSGMPGFDHGVRAAAPTAYGAGDKYYDTNVNYWCFYNSTTWVDISTGLVTCS